MTTNRRTFLTSLATAAAATSLARDWSGQNPERYPDPDVIALDPSFRKYIQGNTPLRRLHTGLLWAEGPAWNGTGNYLVWSDIPNNAQMRYLPEDGHVSVMRSNSNFSNGNTFDWQGRQISCEHATRRVARYEHNGQITVLADTFDGKPLNAPNDVIVHPDGGVWFTDPGYGSMGDYEGNKGELQLKEAVYRIDPSGKIDKVTDELAKPNGLCFSPDYKKLYVVDTGAPKNILVYDVIDGVKLGKSKVFTVANHTLETAKPKLAARISEVLAELTPYREAGFSGLKVPARRRNAPNDAVPSSPEVAKSKLTADQIEAAKKLEAELADLNRQRDSWLKTYAPYRGRSGGSDGVCCDVDGNVWASAGWAGEGYDGVHVFNPEGLFIGHIKLPETTSNLCFGGPKRNRLFITAGQSLYSLYVNTNGAHFC